MLTTKAIDALQPTAKARKVFDGRGLYLEIRPSGSRLWMLKYRVGGKEKRISLGPYPAVSLKDARARSEDARRLLREGIDPSAHRQAERRAGELDGDSLEFVAREWFSRWSSDKTAKTRQVVLRRLELDVFPALGRLPIASLEPVNILPVLRAVEGRGAVETAHRIKTSLGMIFRYGVATGRCQRDPTADLRGALAPAIPTHYPALTEPAEFGKLLRAIDGYGGHPVTLWALRLAPLLAVRPGELRHMEWSEVDLDNATWLIPARKMKLKRDHVVPLAKQAVAILEMAKGLTGGGVYVFPSLRSSARPMSNNTLNAAFRRMGFTTEEVTGHGFRASFRTIGDEVLGIRPDLLEHQLAHAVRDANGRAYNRTQFLADRRDMMQRWADWCDGARQSRR